MKRFVYFGVAAVAICLVGGAVLAVTRPAGNPAATPAPTDSYISLGDSVAAGVGLEPDSDSSACYRTDQAYGHVVAQKSNLKLQVFACTGATIPAGLSGPQEVNKLSVKPQLEQLFAQPKPKFISLTIGANDADWTGVIAKCATAACGSPADTAVVATRLTTMGQGLRAALGDIKKHYGADVPRVVVTGYHQVFPAATPAAGCTDLRGLDDAELAWGRQQQTKLNLALITVVDEYDFARFAPVDFTGHELCSVDSWVQGAGDAQPYHPTAAGQAAYAASVLTAMKAAK